MTRYTPEPGNGCFRSHALLAALILTPLLALNGVVWGLVDGIDSKTQDNRTLLAAQGERQAAGYAEIMRRLDEIREELKDRK